MRFDATGATSTVKIDFRASESAQGRAPWGTPRLAKSDAGQPLLIVADASGAASFYAFSDGRLLRKIQLCDAVGAAVPVVQTTTNGRTLFCAAPDGSFKRWSAETDAVETLDLPLNAAPDLSLGGPRRSLEISPDGQTLYASDESGEFVVWDVAAQKSIYVGQEPVNPAQGERVGVPATTNFISQIRRIDADRFLTLGFNDRWRVWDLSKRDENGVPASVELRDENAEPSRGLRTADLSPSKRYLALADNARNFALYDLQERRAIARSEGALFRDARRLVPSVAAYHPQTDRIVVGFFDHSPLASFSPSSLRVATRFLPYPAPKSSTVKSLDALPSSVAISEIDGEFAAAFESGDVIFFKDGVSEPIGKIENAFVKSEVGYDELLETAYAFSLKAQDAPEILDSPSVLDDLKFQEALLGGNQTGFCNVALLAASPDGSRLIGKTMNGDEFILWDWKTRAEIKRWRVDKFDAPREKIIDDLKKDSRSFIARSSSGLASATIGLEFINETEIIEIKDSGLLVRHDVEKGEPIATIPAPRPNVNTRFSKPCASSFALSSDRGRLALGFDDGCLSVVDLETTQILFFTADFSKPLPNRLQADSFGDVYASPTRRATGLVWSRDDALLCATFADGRGILLETRFFTRLNTFVVADAEPKNALAVHPFFTRDDKLVTVDSHGFLKRWDFRPSPEKPTELRAPNGSNYLSGTSRSRVWAGVCDTTPRFFAVNDGVQELYRRENVDWFQRLTLPGATRETFLLLEETGLLSAIDETGAPVEIDVDWNLGVPEATPETLAALEQARPQRPAASPEAKKEMNRLALEFHRKYPDGDYPEEEFERLLKKFAALSPPPPEEKVAAYHKIVEKLGFVRVAVAPDRQTLAAIGKADGALYLWTRSQRAVGWRLIAKPRDEQKPFARLAFRPDSRELAALEENGAVTFVSSLAPSDSPDETAVWSPQTFTASPQGPSASRLYGALVYASSGRFLLQTGFAPRVLIWDVESRSLAQTIQLDFYQRTLRETGGVSGLASLSLDGESDAFVVAGYDGVLRFYQRNDATSTFAPVYQVSPLMLNDFIASPEEFKARAHRRRYLENQNVDVVLDEPLLWRSTRKIQSLSVSDDQKTLYVGSFGAVYSFDLDEIRRNISQLSEYWRNFDVESATGLRYSPAAGFRFIERDRLVPTVAAP